MGFAGARLAEHAPTHLDGQVNRFAFAQALVELLGEFGGGNVADRVLHGNHDRQVALHDLG